MEYMRILWQSGLPQMVAALLLALLFYINGHLMASGICIGAVVFFRPKQP